MKVFSSVLAVLLASSVGLTGCSLPTSGENSSADARNIQVEDGEIRVLLPDVADVAVKVGESQSGRLTKIEGKQLVIENSGSSAKVDIANVKKVTFKGKVSYYSNGQIVIRGEDKQGSTQRKILADIPVEDFKLKEPSTGQANLKLPQAMSGLLASAKDTPVEVEEMMFDAASGKMTIKVKW